MLTCTRCRCSFLFADAAIAAGLRICPGCKDGFEVDFDCPRCGVSLKAVGEGDVHPCDCCGGALCTGCMLDLAVKGG